MVVQTICKDVSCPSYLLINSAAKSDESLLILGMNASNKTPAKAANSVCIVQHVKVDNTKRFHFSKTIYNDNQVLHWAKSPKLVIIELLYKSN